MTTRARKPRPAAAREARTALAAAREDMAVMLRVPAITAAAKNATLIPAAEKKITRADRALAATQAARDKIPANAGFQAAQPAPGLGIYDVV